MRACVQGCTLKRRSQHVIQSILTCMKRLIGVTYICTRYNEAPRPATPAATTAFCQTSGIESAEVSTMAVSTRRAAYATKLHQLLPAAEAAQTTLLCALCDSPRAATFRPALYAITSRTSWSSTVQSLYMPLYTGLS